MPEPISLATLAVLAGISAVGTGIAGYAQKKTAEAQMKSQEGIAAGNLKLGQDQLSQQDKHFRQNQELQQQQVVENRPSKAMSILGGLGQLKRQQY